MGVTCACSLLRRELLTRNFSHTSLYGVSMTLLIRRGNRRGDHVPKTWKASVSISLDLVFGENKIEITTCPLSSGSVLAICNLN